MVVYTQGISQPNFGEGQEQSSKAERNLWGSAAKIQMELDLWVRGWVCRRLRKRWGAAEGMSWGSPSDFQAFSPKWSWITPQIPSFSALSVSDRSLLLHYAPLYIAHLIFDTPWISHILSAPGGPCRGHQQQSTHPRQLSVPSSSPPQTGTLQHLPPSLATPLCFYICTRWVKKYQLAENCFFSVIPPGFIPAKGEKLSVYCLQVSDAAWGSVHRKSWGSRGNFGT